MGMDNAHRKSFPKAMRKKIGIQLKLRMNERKLYTENNLVPLSYNYICRKQFPGEK
jgi:hypothetical protein